VRRREEVGELGLVGRDAETVQNGERILCDCSTALSNVIEVFSNKEAKMETHGEIPRWLQVPIGLVICLIVLACSLGSVILLVDPPEKSPILGFLLGLVMLLACYWGLEKGVRLVLGRPNQGGGLFSPFALRVLAWLCLALPIAGIFTGLYQEKGATAFVQAAVYVAAFFGLTRLARERSSGSWPSPDDPLFLEAVQRARTSIGSLRALMSNGHELVFVKYPFTTDSGQVEHVWGKPLKLGESDMEVTIETPPIAHRGPVPESLAMSLDSLEDWQAELPDGALRGGFTTRAEIQIRRERGERIPRRISRMERPFVD
jgi:hypothetical protein